MKKNVFRQNMVLPVIELLRQGITPEKIAVSISLGIALGVFPVLGSTTILCMLAAVIFGLNLPAIQIVNYLVYPMQLALLIPFMHLGGWFFGAKPLRLSLSQILGLVTTDTWRAILVLWTATMHAIAAWLCVAPLFVVILSLILARLLRKLRYALAPQQLARGKS